MRARPPKDDRDTKKFATLEALLSEPHKQSGRTYLEHWEGEFNPPLDGRNFRPTVEQAALDSWNHRARGNAKDDRLYVGGWLRREAERRKWSYDKDQRGAPQNDENGWERDAQRALEEMGHG